MIKTVLPGESVQDQLDRWIKSEDGRPRDALNLALARLEAIEATADALQVEIQELRGAATCPDCGSLLDLCSYCKEAR